VVNRFSIENGSKTCPTVSVRNSVVLEVAEAHPPDKGLLLRIGVLTMKFGDKNKNLLTSGKRNHLEDVNLDWFVPDYGQSVCLLGGLACVSTGPLHYTNTRWNATRLRPIATVGFMKSNISIFHVCTALMLALAPSVPYSICPYSCKVFQLNVMSIHRQWT